MTRSARATLGNSDRNPIASIIMRAAERSDAVRYFGLRHPRILGYREGTVTTGTAAGWPVSASVDSLVAQIAASHHHVVNTRGVNVEVAVYYAQFAASQQISLLSGLY